MKIGEHFYLVGSGSDGVFLTDELDCNCYLLEINEKLILFDSGLGIHPEKIEREIIKDGFRMEQLKCLCLTHCHADHAGGAFYFRNKYQAEILAPEPEAEYLEQADTKHLGLETAKRAGYYPKDYVLHGCKVDRKIGPQGCITVCGIQMQVFSAAGHSIGGICYYGHMNGKSFLAAGDLLNAEGKMSLQFIPGADVLEYAQSVQRLAGIDIDYFLPGHGRFLLQQGRRAVDKAIRSFAKLMVPV